MGILLLKPKRLDLQRRKNPTEIRRMSRDQTQPVTDEEIEALREDIEEVRREVREDLAADFGGDPEDYRADKLISDDGE